MTGHYARRARPCSAGSRLRTCGSLRGHRVKARTERLREYGMAGTMDEQEGIELRLARAEALAAGAVLRGYLSHQRERLGAQAAANRSEEHTSELQSRQY